MEKRAATIRASKDVFGNGSWKIVGFYADIFDESKASWPRTREGLAQMRKRYPESIAIVEASAYLAALAGDDVLVARMRVRYRELSAKTPGR